MENYQVQINKPFSSRFLKGAVFGYNVSSEVAENHFYWEGNDLWIPQETDLNAIFKGTLKYYPNGSNLHPDFEDQDYYPTPTNVIGDALVLTIWPQDYLKLNEILPEGSPVPKTVVYQNVDRTACLEASLSLIMANKVYYKQIFKRESENEISDEVLEDRVQLWLNNAWILGEGNGILVSSGAIIGKVATTSPPSSGGTDNNNIVPDGSGEMRRFTVKYSNDKNYYCNPSFLFYLLSNYTNNQLVCNWTAGDAFIENCNVEIQALPKIRIFYHTNAEQDTPDGIPENAVFAYPDTEVWLSNESISSKIPGFFDFHASESESYWRIQGWPPVGIYQIQTVPTFQVGPLTSPPYTYHTLTITIGSDGRFNAQPTDPTGFVDIRERWLRFGSEHKYVLGVNMETLRRQHFHDLSGNALLVRKNSTGAYERIYTFSNAWLTTNATLLEEDFNALQGLGVTSVRIWAFELLEGIEFNFLPLLDAHRSVVDGGSIDNLTSRIFPDGRVIHACTQTEFLNLLNRWRGALTTLSANFISSAGRTIINNALRVMEIAERKNIKIFWTLFTHYGEALNIGAELTYPTLIYYCHDRMDSSGTIIQPPSITASNLDWLIYYSNDLDFLTEARLPIEAWIYKFMITDSEIRRSVMDQIVIPFIRDIITPHSQNIMGFEIMNESDIIWEDTSQSWAHRIKGGLIERNIIELDASNRLRYQVSGRNQRTTTTIELQNILTNWKLSRSEIRTFIIDCQQAIRAAGWSGCITSSVMGQNDHYTFNELDLLKPQSDSLNLTCSAISRYSETSKWMGYFNIHPNPSEWRSYRPHRVSKLDTPSRHTPLIHNHKLLFSEAGDYQYIHNISNQQMAVREALKAGIRLGYAGMFIWHYNNPARSTEDSENNPLTAFSGDSSPGIFFPPGSSIRMRPAAREIMDFIHAFRPILYP